MIKAKIKLLLHSILGFERFLYYFSLFKIAALRFDKNEKDIFLFIDKLKEQKREGLILDIGANIGIMTGTIARHTKSFIHAFEPLPLNSAIFEKVITRLKIQDRVKLHKIALGNTEGFCEMVLPVVENVRMHGLSHVVDPSIKDFNDGQVVSKIPMNRLDNLFKDDPILGIKLDVENFEFEVLKGAENILKTHKPIIYSELWDNENRQNCFKYLRKLGYRTFYNNQGSLEFFSENVTTTQTFVFA